MSKSWPPSPMVEDEVVSLAKEHCSDVTDTEASNGIAPPETRGAVDQYPLIIDVNEKSTGPHPGKRDAVKKPQQHVSQTDHQRNSPSHETRFVHLPPTSDNDSEIPRPPRRLRSKSTIGIAADEDSRGRPQVSRINTDLGGDLHSMATGQRRAPSPYSYRASTSTLLPSLLDDKSKVSLLSPESSTALPLPSANRRARSQRPERIVSKVEGSDSDSRRSDYARRRSKSRHDRGSFSKTSGDERTASGRDERSRYESRRPRRSPSRGERRGTSHRAAHGNITPPQTPGHAKESPYTSAAEDSERRRHHERHRTETRSSKESPYTSAAEGRPSRREQEDKYQTRSRRQSMHRPGKPHIDLSDQATSIRPGPVTPLSARTPRTLEEDIEQAFKDNQKKQNRRYASGEGTSPFTSPPTSPPRTPRGERKSKDKDYFAMTAPVSNMSKQRSRPPSISDNPIKPMTTLLSAATLGAASLAAKAIPNTSRSSTASLETPSTGSQGSLASGQRSRKPSPVYDEPRVLSRNNSTTSNDGAIPGRSSTLPPLDERPVSRAGSVASQDGGRSHSTTPSIHEERPPSRNGTLHSPMPHPPPTHRSSSYSTLPEQAHSRPSAHRTYSTLPGSGAGTKSAAQSRLPHSHLSQPPVIASAYVSSPSSEKPLDGVPAQSDAPITSGTLDKSANSAGKEQAKKQISFPVCPRPYPVTGVSTWYTISGLVKFDICSSCMRVLVESPLRDYCIPSPWKPPTSAVTCALSRPWVRIVVARCLKDGVTNIGLLQSLSSLPPDVYPCPGRQTEIRRWYHVVDPETKAPVQGFNVCTACVRNAELVFPELWKEKIFERPDVKLAQERYCNLFTGSKHFYSIVNQLDVLAGYSKKKDLRKKDISAFGDFVRKKARYRECARDAMLATPLWHYMPSLPELTICEECYEEVVWPLNEKPIARDIIMTLQKVPIQRPAHYVAGISCQLYSDRMRKIFKDAVNRNDFESLRSAALARYNIEHRLQEYHRRFELDQQQGYDRRADIEKNVAYWKQYE